jgi:hypothetical protein
MAICWIAGCSAEGGAHLAKVLAVMNPSGGNPANDLRAFHAVFA